MEYLNFDLRIADWTPSTHTGTIEVLRSPSGEGERLPFFLELETKAWVKEAPYSLATATTFGTKLAASLFQEEIYLAWYASYQIAREREMGLRLRLHMDAIELSMLPWELLYDVRKRDFFVFDERVSLVRYMRVPTEPPALRQAGTLRVLVVAASPVDQAPLRWEKEVELLTTALAPLKEKEAVEIAVCAHATRESLRHALLEHSPDVVHFVGHGVYDGLRREGYLVLEDEHQRSDQLRAAEVALVLRRYDVNLAVLNACQTAKGAWASVASQLVQSQIPAVVAMQWPIEDAAAVCFSRSFYLALSLGKTIDRCVGEGRVGIRVELPQSLSWAAPVLFLRSPTGQLWARHPYQFRKEPREDVSSEDGRSFERAGRPLFPTYGPLRPSTDGALLVRRSELDRILRVVRQPVVTQYVALLGSRQTAKTTLLFQLMDELQEGLSCVFVDLSVLYAQDVHSCFRYLAFRLVSELRDQLGPDFALPPSRGLQSSVEFLQFMYELARAVPIPRIVLLIDRVGALTPETADVFFNTLRTVFSHSRGVRTTFLSKYLFVFSGATDLYSLTFGTNSPLNICEKVYLQDFSPEQVNGIVDQFNRLGIPVREEAKERVYTYTAGHPYLTVRLCALMEQAGIQQVTAEAVDEAAEQMLMGDDNIRNLVEEVRRRPEVLKLVGRILRGEAVRFSRNNPMISALEMIGVVRGGRYCELRNELYARALAQQRTSSVETSLFESRQNQNVEATYRRLEALRQAALTKDGEYKGDKAWETFAAALLLTVPVFSVWPDAQMVDGKTELLLRVDVGGKVDSYWSAYEPSILVTCVFRRDLKRPDLVDMLVSKATLYRAKLVLALTTQDPPPSSGMREGICVLFLSDAQIAQLLHSKADLDAFLQARALDAHLRQI